MDPPEEAEAIANETIGLMYELCPPQFVETLWDEAKGEFRTCCEKSQVGLWMQI